MTLHDNQLFRILANSLPAELTGPGSGDTPRRHFLHAATAATVAVSVGYAADPFLSSPRPSARAQARGGPVQGDLTQIEPGQLITVAWRGKPVWIVRRTAEMRQRLSDSQWLTHLSDPLSLVRMQQPVYARNGARSLREEYFVAIGLCTHLGCVPLFVPQPDDTRFSDKWIGGFFCLLSRLPVRSGRERCQKRAGTDQPGDSAVQIRRFTPTRKQNRLLRRIGEAT